MTAKTLPTARRGFWPKIKPMIGRRTLLQSLLAGAMPGLTLGALTGCGGGGNEPAADEAALPTFKPLVTSIFYSADANPSVPSTRDELQVDVTPVPDRLDGSLPCRRFNGQTSVAKANLLPVFTTAEFAISFWQRHTLNRAMPALTLHNADGALILAIDLNQQHAVSVRVGESRQAWLATGLSGDLTDNAWHHVLVQRAGPLLQLFVDGAHRAEQVAPAALGVATTLQAGASPWQGDLDDIQLHDRAFDAGQVPHKVYAWQQIKPSIEVNYIGYFPFNGDARNDTGHGWNGVPHRVLPATDRFGQANAAYAFNGVDAHVELQDSYDVVNGDYAIGFWLKSSAGQAMAALSISPGANALDFVCNGNHALGLAINGLAQPALSFGSPGGLTDDRWHFVLAQQQQQSFQIYVDGRLRASAERRTPAFGPGSRVRFGRGSELVPRATGHWSGLLDDVQVHERSFNASQIKALEGMQFRPRDGAGLLSFQGRLWLLGGWNPDDRDITYSQVWSSPDGHNWALAAQPPWQGRHTAGWLVFNNRLWVIGGDYSRGHYQNDVWSSADGVSWQLATDSPPWANRVAPQVLVLNDRIWLMGGVQTASDSGTPQSFNDVYSSADGAHWRLETPQAPWRPRGLIMGGVVFRNRMWVIGGGQYAPRTYENDVWSSADGINWTQALVNAPWAPRQYQSVTVFDGKIWVVAGCVENQTSGSNHVWYSNDGVHWVELSATPWPARHAASVVARDRQLWLLAGSSTQLFNDVWTLGHAA